MSLGDQPLASEEGPRSTAYAAVDLKYLLAGNARIRYARARELLWLAERDPARFYPSLDVFLGLLNSDKRILRWNAIRIVGLLARADEDDRVSSLRYRFYDIVRGGEMIAASHALRALRLIAQSTPALGDEIAREIVKVDRYEYETPECRDIVIGKAIDELDAIYGELQDGAEALEFVRRQTGNHRAATRKKAERFLRRQQRRLTPAP